MSSAAPKPLKRPLPLLRVDREETRRVAQAATVGGAGWALEALKHFAEESVVVPVASQTPEPRRRLPSRLTPKPPMLVSQGRFPSLGERMWITPILLAEVAWNRRLARVSAPVVDWSSTPLRPSISLSLV